MRPAIVHGLRFGIALAIVALLLGWLGTAPEFHWIPEVPLLLVTAAIPIGICAAAGWRTASGAQARSQAALAGAITGALGGVAGGLYFAIAAGKPAVNVPVLLVVGVLGGAVAGVAGGYFGERR